MKLKNMWKRFWTLDVHNHEGFTLVELIIVIAILAILSTGAIAGYSAYVERANKTADQALLSEIENVLLMAYYNGDITTEASVVLGADGVVKTSGTEVDGVLEAAYGTNWAKALQLKWTEYKAQNAAASYAGSSYFGNEGELIGVIDNLTGALGNAAQNLADANVIGSEFSAFLDDKDISISDGKAVGNAAVLYVADKTVGKTDLIQNAFANAAATANGGSDMAQKVFGSLQAQMGSAAAMAVIFAYAEGYAQYSEQASEFHQNTDFSNVSNVNDALAALGNAFDSLSADDFSAYISTGKGTADINAYIDMMGTVKDKQSVVSGNLKADDCFTDGVVENLLKDHAALSKSNVTTEDGQAAVALWFDKNGNVESRVIAPEK